MQTKKKKETVNLLILVRTKKEMDDTILNYSKTVRSHHLMNEIQTSSKSEILKIKTHE